jgi:hypothetical protein
MKRFGASTSARGRSCSRWSRDYDAAVRRLLNWLRRQWYGEDQIAVSIRGQETISEEELLALPKDVRANWELVEGFGAYVKRPS